jgi:hypothetical protein
MNREAQTPTIPPKKRRAKGKLNFFMNLSVINSGSDEFCNEERKKHYALFRGV